MYNKRRDLKYEAKGVTIMKKLSALVLALVLSLTCFAMADTIEPDVKGEGVMTYAEYAAAALETEVTVETYVQDKQSWWDNKCTIYTQDKDGAYFIYEMPCSAEDYEKLVPGTKIKVTGFKVEWSGEVEISDVSSFEILEGSYIPEATDMTALVGTEELINSQNMLSSFVGMTVAASTDKDGNEAAFLYNWDGSGVQGDDLYFNATINDVTVSFCVEKYLRDADTDVYKAVEALQIGDVIDITGFLYWYNGAQPHVISIAPAAK